MMLMPETAATLARHGMNQTAMLLIDAFEPEGFTTLAKDSIFMGSQLVAHLLMIALIIAGNAIFFVGRARGDRR